MTSEGFDESLSSPLVISPSPRGGSVKVERARVLRVSPGHGTMPESRFWTHFSGSTRALLLKDEVVEMGQSVPAFCPRVPTEGRAVSAGQAAPSPNPGEEGAGFWGE